MIGLGSDKNDNENVALEGPVERGYFGMNQVSMASNVTENVKI